MRFFILIIILSSISCNAQDWKHLYSKLDSTNGKYGYVDSANLFVIKPIFDEARDFVSEYTSVRIDSLWGVIDTTGKFVLQPQFSRISVVYRECFLESGPNYKFRTIHGIIMYEYLFIPGPFPEMKYVTSDEEVIELEDYQIIIRVMQMLRGSCHYYEMNRLLNSIAIETEKYGKMTIDFVLENPERVLSWINKDKEFEAAFARGEIECCGYGPVWYGE